MPIGLGDSLNFHGQALELRSKRQEILASNIANADTPGYKARDINFAESLLAVTSAKPKDRAEVAKQIPVLYRRPDQPSGDGNSVEMDREKANFADNSLRYEATLRFINGRVRGLLSAIRGD